MNQKLKTILQEIEKVVVGKNENVEKFCKIYLKNGKQNENDFGREKRTS